MLIGQLRNVRCVNLIVRNAAMASSLSAVRVTGQSLHKFFFPARVAFRAAFVGLNLCTY